MTETSTDRRDARHLLEELIPIAERLGPEGEGLDLEELELTRDELVDLRSRASTIRSAIDEVNRALARTFADTLPNPRAVLALDDRLIARISWTNPRAYWLDDNAEGFATWLKDQDVATIAKVVSTWSRRDGVPIPGIRKSTVPKAVWETFTVTRHEDKATPTLEVTDRANIDTQWIQRLAPGDLGVFRAPNIELYEKGHTPAKICDGCHRFYSMRNAHQHAKCQEPA